MTEHSSLFLAACRRQPVPRPPVWLMRQAGRYLPEYRAVRAQAGSFMDLCTNPELAAEVTLQPIRRFGLDAAIIFSDILTIPDAMGLGLGFVENEGPKFAKPVQSTQDIIGLPNICVETELAYVFEAIAFTKQALPTGMPLIGFCGSPWTLATYMVEGGSSRNFSKIKAWGYQAPADIQQLLAKITQALIPYCLAQVSAGADCIMIFDTWGGVLAAEDYALFSLRYMADLVQALKQQTSVPVILFSKNCGQQLGLQAQTGADVLGLDWTTSLAAAKTQVGHQVALQGNLDPILLLTNPECVADATRRLIATFGPAPGLIVNLGHGVVPQTPPEHVVAMVDTVTAFRYQCEPERA